LFNKFLLLGRLQTLNLGSLPLWIKCPLTFSITYKNHPLHLVQGQHRCFKLYNLALCSSLTQSLSYLCCYLFTCQIDNLQGLDKAFGRIDAIAKDNYFN
jgi:hypothetical protein